MSQMAVGSLFLAAVTAAARPPPHLVFLLGDEVRETAGKGPALQRIKKKMPQCK